MPTEKEGRETAADLGLCWLYPNFLCREIRYITAVNTGFQGDHQLPLAFLKAFPYESL